MRRIILLGYMGAGKTTIGKVLAQKLSLEFFDLDWYIEDRFRMKIPQIFAEKGEEGFREIERKMLHEVAEFENVVISCGGGTPCFFDNMEYMNRQAKTIYLKATPEVLMRHLQMGKSQRPLIQGKSPEELKVFIKDSLEKREPFYSQAKYTMMIDVLETKERIYETTDQLIIQLKLDEDQL